MRKHKSLLYFLFFIFILIQECDPDKYFGYNYEVDRLIQSSKISGTVLMSYTNTPVENAIIQIGNQTTLSDVQGKYTLDYIFEDDEDRDKSIDVIVSADKYITYITSIVIYPVENQLNISLDYGAPIIEKMTLVDGISQAIITDYQGYSDIKSVKVHLYYKISPPDPFKIFVEPMNFKQAISNTTAYYQYIADTVNDEWGTLYGRYKIVAEDWQGFADSIMTNATGNDTLLFPVNF